MRVGRQTCIYYAINLLANEFSHDPFCAYSFYKNNENEPYKTACGIQKKNAYK